MKKMAGVNLMELMVVVAIVGVIAALAIPQYSQYVERSRRTEAQAALLQLADRQEKNFLRNNAYTNSFTNLGVSSTTESGLYNLSIALGAGNRSYTLTATAQGTQVNDTDCVRIIINNIGQKSSAKSDGTATTGCWSS